MIVNRADPRVVLRLALAAVVLVAVASALLDPGVFCVVPALALPVVLLVFDRYPGERVLLAISAARRPHPVRLPKLTGRPRSVARFAPRGGLLIASSLANRPPPRSPLAA